VLFETLQTHRKRISLFNFNILDTSIFYKTPFFTKTLAIDFNVCYDHLAIDFKTHSGANCFSLAEERLDHGME